MARPIMGKKTAHALSFVLFAIGIAALAYFQIWWPALILVLGLPIALKHYLCGEFFDAFLSLFIFFGLFITFQWQIKLNILLPIFFTISGIYIFFREFIGSKNKSDQDNREDGEEEYDEEKDEEDEKEESDEKESEEDEESEIREKHELNLKFTSWQARPDGHGGSKGGTMKQFLQTLKK